MGLAHLACQLARRLDLDQLALADSRTPVAGLEPFLLVIDQLRPEGEQAALRRLGRMDRAAILAQKSAIGFPWDAQSAEVGSAIDEFAFEGRAREPQEV